MADTTGMFVQFPHPGGEHAPPGEDMPWNVADHRRKFLVAPGEYVDGDGPVRHAELMFWGEWEPPSRIERRWPTDGRFPRVLHRPYWIRPRGSGFRQNTDPWVFGDQMIYSNCKQIVGPQRRATSMQRLPRGSMICFGSTIAGEFCVDTVFVVASAEPWVPAEEADLDVGEAFKACTGDVITRATTDMELSLTLYRGATVDEPVEGIYSFVPARCADHDQPRFARPPVHLPGLVNPASRQSTWGSRRPLPMERLRDAWEALCHQVLAADLVLATRLQTPDGDTDEGIVPEPARQRC